MLTNGVVLKHNRFGFSLAAFAAILLLGPAAQWAEALTIQVVDQDGVPVTGFRWLVEEDTTYHVRPGEIDANTLAVRFHSSYMPTVANGDSSNPTVTLDPAKYYFVSVLPYIGYTLSGAPVAPGQQEVTIIVHDLPIPTAQIKVFVFEDNFPINNAPDLPEERGLEGFTVILEEPGGRYGMAGGRVMQDPFGNMIGSTYNPDGTLNMMGMMEVMTDANGEATFKNVAPGKYGVLVIPPPGQGWVQTSTIEGTKVIDAWVKANEPPYFMEFGPPGWHVFVGFVKPTNDTTVLTGGSTITGQIVNLHLSRPPDAAMWPGAPFAHTTPWVGLNDLSVGIGKGVYAQRCNDDGTFSIPNVPPGNYQLVVWDDNLDIVFAFLGVIVPTGGADVVLGEVPVFQWFTRLENHVFLDRNENGFWDVGEPGIPEQAVNLRWRDGTMYQSMATDLDGFAPFDEVFPFFNWLVAEVDFARFKATGVTVVVDDGGPIDPIDPWTFEGQLNPQPQSENNNLPYRTETGPVLTQAFQGFLGQTSVMMWGKNQYGPGENGGISGLVFYAVTRAEDDPRYAAAEPWEPGIPRVQMNLYADGDVDNPPWGDFPGADDIDWNANGVFEGPDGVIEDVDGDGVVELADVDNYPFGNFPGPEDQDRDYLGQTPGLFDAGDALQITSTDSWDDDPPTGAQGDVFYFHGVPTDAYDGMRNWNQVRPGVFDGGYAFDSYYPGGMASGSTEVAGLPTGTYIVEAVPPPSYEILKEEDRNVDFGEEYVPSQLFLPPVCVGDLRLVPQYLSFQTDENGTLLPGIDPADAIETPFFGQVRPLSDRKQVHLQDTKNAAADFFMFTEVPIAGHIVGMILNDLANEFDPNSPQFGEKYAPPWLPISIRDWTGTEISRVYSDEYGTYNALVPSTYTTNLPMPSGMGPNMLTVVLNDPGPIPNPDYNPADPTSQALIIDPFFDRQYSQFSYTFQYMPGVTTYLDTPVIPVAAFAGPNQFPLDCEFPDGTPKLFSVTGPLGRGPYIPDPPAGVPPRGGGLRRITIVSEGMVPVPNPAYEGPNTVTPKMITRDYGFGNVKGTVTIGGTPLIGVHWTPQAIFATVPLGVTTGQLVVTRGDNGKSTPVGVTVTVGGPEPLRVPPGGSVQAAIDIADPGELILLPPGIYDELVIMWKPVRLQGWGAASTIINAVKVPAEKLHTWRLKIQDLVNTGAVDLLPAQETGAGGVEPVLLFNEEGPGIIVLAKNTTAELGGFGLSADGLPNAWIDGLTITGADHAGGVVVNGYANYLTISNNSIANNNGVFGGGIRIGHPQLLLETLGGLVFQDGYNDHIRIHHNHITRNAGQNGAGGGISLYTGTDLYEITDNAICGNFTMGNGAGIGHFGLSDGGLIARNSILFNQSFNQGMSVSGGGVYIGGEDPVPNAGIALTPGSGSVKILSNLIQGNLAGAGDGGGIRLSLVNGADVASNSDAPDNWHTVDIFNNLIVNNVAGLAGGAVSMQDAAMVHVLNNTVANNDSTATASEAFPPGSPGLSSPQPAGIVSRPHSPELAAAFGASPAVDPYKVFSNPALVNNIVWHNRSFYFYINDLVTPADFGLLSADQHPTAAAPEYWDLAVLGAAAPTSLSPLSCLLTDMTGYDASNTSVNPLFVSEYFNGPKNNIVLPEPKTGIQIALALDEGGNFVDVRFGPLTLTGNYHLQTGSGAIDQGDTAAAALFAELSTDYDAEGRPSGADVDIGADEVQ